MTGAGGVLGGNGPLGLESDGIVRALLSACSGVPIGEGERSRLVIGLRVGVEGSWEREDDGVR